MSRNQLLYGLIAGATIFLGLPVALFRRISQRTYGFLNAVSTGILIFMLVEIMGKSLEAIEELLEPAHSGYPVMHTVWSFSAQLMAGLVLGLLGMVFFE